MDNHGKPESRQRVIHGTHIGNFSNAVNAELAKGWRLTGRIYTTQRDRTGIKDESERIEDVYWATLETENPSLFEKVQR